jgi:hypothetical protein
MMRFAHVHSGRWPHPARSPAAGHPVRRSRAARPIAPEALALFSDRLDDARDYEMTVRDFVLAHGQTRSADDYDS